MNEPAASATTPASAALPPPTAERPALAAPRASLAGRLALVLALFSVVIAGSLWWQYRQFYLELDDSDTGAALELERVRASVRALRDDLDLLGKGLADNERATATATDRIERVPARIAELERRVDSTQGTSFDSRNRWLRAEAEYYLALASTELALAGRFATAVRALELADERLAALGDPTLTHVRELIGEELRAVQAVRVPDLEGLVVSLSRLAVRAPELPFRADLPVTLGDTPGAPDTEPGFDRLLSKLHDALSTVVRVERRDEPVPHALSNAEKVLRAAELEVQIAVAQVAALRGERAAFETALRSVQRSLASDYDTHAPEVDSALKSVRDLLLVDVAPRRPDLGRALAALRRADADGI